MKERQLKILYKDVSNGFILDDEEGTMMVFEDEKDRNGNCRPGDRRNREIGSWVYEEVLALLESIGMSECEIDVIVKPTEKYWTLNPEEPCEES